MRFSPSVQDTTFSSASAGVLWRNISLDVLGCTTFIMAGVHRTRRSDIFIGASELLCDHVMADGLPRKGWRLLVSVVTCLRHCAAI